MRRRAMHWPTWRRVRRVRRVSGDIGKVLQEINNTDIRKL